MLPKTRHKLPTLWSRSTAVCDAILSVPAVHWQARSVLSMRGDGLPTPQETFEHDGDLASDESRHINGAIIPADAGWAAV